MKYYTKKLVTLLLLLSITTIEDIQNDSINFVGVTHALRLQKDTAAYRALAGEKEEQDAGKDVGSLADAKEGKDSESKESVDKKEESAEAEGSTTEKKKAKKSSEKSKKKGGGAAGSGKSKKKKAKEAADDGEAAADAKSEAEAATGMRSSDDGSSTGEGEAKEEAPSEKAGEDGAEASADSSSTTSTSSMAKKTKKAKLPKISASDKTANPTPTTGYDDTVFDETETKKPTVLDQLPSGYNGGDEYEIMDKVIKAYSQQAVDVYGNTNKQLMLSKKSGRRAAEVLLEACHKLKRDQVPVFVEKQFDDSWQHYDQNNEGWLRYEETFQFVRHLFGRLNGFAGAPGSIGDVESGGSAYPLVYPLSAETTKVGKV